MIASLLRWAAARIDPPKRDPQADAPLPTSTELFRDEDLASMRRRNALELIDEETCGYLLVMLRDTHGFMQLVPEIALPTEAWPAMRRCLATIIRESQRVAL